MTILQIKLNNLATLFVGSNKKPNVFFVTDDSNVVTMTLNFDVAYDHWRMLAARVPLQQCTLEDCAMGILCSVEPIADGSTMLRKYDGSSTAINRRR